MCCFGRRTARRSLKTVHVPCGCGEVALKSHPRGMLLKPPAVSPGRGTGGAGRRRTCSLAGEHSAPNRCQEGAALSTSWALPGRGSFVHRTLLARVSQRPALSLQHEGICQVRTGPLLGLCVGLPPIKTVRDFQPRGGAKGQMLGLFVPQAFRASSLGSHTFSVCFFLVIKACYK